jgi:NDP-sugar pyrophosphorylase family protein
MSTGSLATVDAVILCGGLGTRLQSVVGDRPKAMALVQGRPFLDLLLDELVAQGLQRFILCVGHMREQIAAHLTARTDAEFLCSEETEPLGTGGAVHHALGLVSSDPFMLHFHQRSQAGLTLAAAPAGERRDAGTLEIAGDGRLLAFEEKAGAGERINAGIYLMDRRITALWPDTYPYSIERDILPGLVRSYPCFAFNTLGPVHDIGTPDRYRSAQAGLP